MVRLKLGNKWALVAFPVFQFLNGSIKAGITPAFLSVYMMFQFLNGSIKAKIQHRITEPACEVSIPQWFD